MKAFPLSAITNALKERTKLCDSMTNDNDASGSSSSCPFSKQYPKFRINFTKVGSKKKQGLSLPFVGNLQRSLDRNKLQTKFPGIQIQWLDGNDVSAIKIFSRLWRETSNLSASTNADRVVLGLTDHDASKFLGLVQHWMDILKWMQEENAFSSLLGNVRINSTIYTEGDLIAVELVREGGEVITPDDNLQQYDSETLSKRTQSWVKRILVEQGICPFTKSAKVSGQGLGDLGIPVARIYYCSSHASPNQISKLMAGM